MDKPLEFCWLGVAGFELSIPGLTLLVDPFLTRPPSYKLLFGRTRPDGALLRQHLPQADVILVSHAHYDHLLDVAEVAGYTGAVVYGSENSCRLVAVCGLPAEQVLRVNAGEELTLTPVPSPFKREGSIAFQVTILPGEHTPVPVFKPGRLPKHLHYPLRLRDFVMDEDFGFLIRAGESSLLAWHDWHPGPAPRADVLVIGADIRLPDLGELLDQVQPRLLIPTHWDNFFRPLRKPPKPFFRPPCPDHPLPERYDPWDVQRWVTRNRPEVEVWVPGLMEQIEL